jgi:inorganic pyrophosphatase
MEIERHPIGGLVLALVVAYVGCAEVPSPSGSGSAPGSFASPHDFLSDFSAVNDDGTVNVVIEIPAGTTAKWEVTEPEGRLEWETDDGKPRVVMYLGYPGSYGMVPRTLLPGISGGDGDPLDVIVLGDAQPRGSVVRAKIVGVLRLVDGGETDDKLLAVLEGSPLYEVADLQELESSFAGVTTIVETWFENYKGPDEVESLGFEGVGPAMKILDQARESFNQGQLRPERGVPPESEPRSP